MPRKQTAGQKAASAKRGGKLQLVPPAEKGNRRALKHGAWGREVDGLAHELEPALYEDNKHLDPRRNAPAVYRYLTLLVRIELVYRWLGTRKDPIFSNRRTGKAHAIYERLERWENQASKEEDRLAISPLTRARLKMDTAKTLDLANALSEEDPERRKAMLAGSGLEDE